MGRRAYGWTADVSGIVETEAAELRRALYEIDGGKPVKQIIREMNGRGLATSQGNEWSITALSRALKNPRMIGRKADSLDRPIMQGEMAFPPILTSPADIECWKRVRKILTDPARKQPRNQPAKLLSGKVICGNCGKNMYPTYPVERNPRYACRHDIGCGRWSIKASIADEYIEDVLTVRARNTIPGASEASVGAWWTRAKMEEKRELLAGFIAEVTVLGTAAGRNGSDRLVVVWEDMPAWPTGLAAAA